MRPPAPKDLIGTIRNHAERIRRLELRPLATGGVTEEVYDFVDADFWATATDFTGWETSGSDNIAPRAFRVGNLVYWNGLVNWRRGADADTYPYSPNLLLRAGALPATLRPQGDFELESIAHAYIADRTGSPIRRYALLIYPDGSAKFDEDHLPGASSLADKLVIDGSEGTTFKISLNGVMYPVSATL